MEEIWLDKKIKTIYGISTWAIIASLRSAWHSADNIFDLYFNTNWLSYKNINLVPKLSLLKSDSLEKNFKKYLPSDISKLDRKVYIWAANVYNGEMTFFSKWDLSKALLASSAIPWIFPPVEIDKYIYVDWWLINNFPAEIIKKKYPNKKIIGIALNKFIGKEKVNSIFNVLSVSFEIFLRKSNIENIPYVDYLFYPKLDLAVFDTNKTKMKKAFEQWYEDCKKIFN